MSNFNEHIIYRDPEQCLSEKVVERYLAGKLSDKEQAMVARHLEQCSFCSEAIEGSLLLKNPEKLGAISDSINSKINKKLLNKPAYLGAKVAAAAVVLTLFSVGIYGYLNFSNAERESMYAENFSKYPHTLNMDSVLGKLHKEEQIEAEPPMAANRQTQPSVAVVEESASEPVAAKDAEMDMVMAPPPPPPAAEKSTARRGATSVERMQSQTENKESAGAPTMEEAEIREVQISSTKSKENVFQKAITLFDKNQYPEAIELFDEAKQEQMYMEQSLLYTGISYLQLGQPELAIKNFDQLLDIKNTPLEETALWYKALSYIKLDDTREAKSILKKVINKNGIYKEKAERLRNSL